MCIFGYHHVNKGKNAQLLLISFSCYVCKCWLCSIFVFGKKDIKCGSSMVNCIVVLVVLLTFSLHNF